MSSSPYHYHDPDFNPEQEEGNILMLMITDTEFSFSVIERLSQKVLVWGQDYKLEELADPKLLGNIIGIKYDFVKVGVLAKNFTIIPADLYNEHDIHLYERLLAPVTGDSIIVNKLDQQNFVIFKINELLTSQISKHFELKNVVFGAKAWLAAINYGRTISNNLYGHIEGNTLHLLYLKNGSFNFYNRFECTNPDELMYYIILTANELNLNMDENSLILSGEISFMDKKIQRVSDMLPKVYFNQTQILAMPPGYLSHQILMLAGLTLCV